MQNRGRFRERLLNFNDHGQRLVLHLHEVKRVFSDVAVFCHHDGDWLADVTHAVYGENPVLHGLLHTHHKRLCPRLDILSGQNRAHARKCQSLGCVNPNEPCVGVWRAQNCSFERAGANADVICERAPAVQQGVIFQAFNALANPGLASRLCE